MIDTGPRTLTLWRDEFSKFVKAKGRCAAAVFRDELTGEQCYEIFGDDVERYNVWMLRTETTKGRVQNDARNRSNAGARN